VCQKAGPKKAAKKRQERRQKSWQKSTLPYTHANHQKKNFLKHIPEPVLLLS